MISLQNLHTFQEILKQCEKITPEMITRFGKKLEPHGPKEKEVGWVNDDIKHLFCAAELFEAEKQLCKTQANIALTEEASEDLKLKARKYGLLETLIRNMFWMEVMQENNYFKDDIMVRQDFMIFARPVADGGPSGRVKQLLQMMGLPPEAFHIQLGPGQEDEDDDH